MSKIGDLLRQLAIAYDDMEKDNESRFTTIDSRIGYIEDKVHRSSIKLDKIRDGLSSLVDSLKDEGDIN